MNPPMPSTAVPLASSSDAALEPLSVAADHFVGADFNRATSPLLAEATSMGLPPPRRVLFIPGNPAGKPPSLDESLCVIGGPPVTIGPDRGVSTVSTA